MTKQEVIKLLSMISMLYPRHRFLPEGEEKIKLLSELWLNLLGDMPFDLASASMQKHAIDSPFPPTVSDLRKIAAKITSPDLFSPAVSAWGEVERAIRKFGNWDINGALESMSPLTRRIVEAIGFREICFSENPGVERGQFLKLYAQYQEREIEQATITPGLRGYIESCNPVKKLQAPERIQTNERMLPVSTLIGQLAMAKGVA